MLATWRNGSATTPAADHVYPEHIPQVVESDALLLRIDGRACSGGDGDLEPVAQAVDRRLEHAHLGRRAGEEDSLHIELAQDEDQRGRVEGRIAGLHDEALAFARRDLLDEVAGQPLLDSSVNEPGSVTVPDARVVVRIDDRGVVFTRALERRLQGVEPLSVGLEQPVPVLVAEVLDHVDEEQCAGHAALRSDSRRCLSQRPFLTA